MEDSQFEILEIDPIDNAKLIELEKDGQIPFKWDVVSKEQDRLFQRTLKALYNKKNLSDVIVIHTNEKFFCHSLVLIQCDFFKELIGKMKKKDEVLELDITKSIKSKSAFKIILKYMYYGIFYIPEKGKEIEIYRTAKELGHKRMQDYMLGYMATYFSAIEASKFMEYSAKNKFYYLEDVCLKLISSKITKVFESNLIFKFPKELVLSIIKSNNLDCDEFLIFQAVKKYCKNYAKTKKISFITIWKEFEEFIRYPQMTSHELVFEVEPLKIVDKKYIFEAIKFNALNDHPKLQEKFFGKSNFRFKERSGFGFTFKWQKKNLPSNCTISKKGTTISYSKNNIATSWFGDKAISKKGIYYWDIKIVNTPSYSNLMIGIGDNTIPTNQWIGNNARGWCIYCNQGNKYHRGSSTSYCSPKPKKGDIITIILDYTNLSAGKIYFAVNGKKLGLAFSDVTGTVYPACTLYANTDQIEICAKSSLPKNWKN